MVVLALAVGCAQTAPPPAKTAAAGPPAAGGTAAAKAIAVAPATVVGPPLSILPAAIARSALLASIAIPSIDRALAGGTALLARAVPLGLDGPAVKELLLSQAGLPPEVGKNLDTASPAGAAVVALGEKGEAGGVGLVMAIPAKGAAEAERVIAALGQVISKRGEVVEIDNRAGGRGWVWRSGSVIVLSDSVVALTRGAMAALEARQAVAKEDVAAVLYPDAIARANGTDVRTALAALLAQMRAMQAAQAEAAAAESTKTSSKTPGKTPAAASGAGPAISESAFDAMELVASYIPDAESVEIGVVADPARGLVLDLRLDARAASPLGAIAAAAHPFTIDPALAVTAGDVSLAGASAYGPYGRAVLAKQRARIQASHEKGAPNAAQLLDAWTEAIAGPYSVVGRVKPSLSLQAIYPLKDAAAGAKLAAALGRADTATVTAFWKTQMAAAQAQKVSWTVKKETVGKVKALRVSVLANVKTTSPRDRERMKAVLGASSLDMYLAVVGDRAILAGGKDGKAQLAALAAGKTRLADKKAVADGEKGGAQAELLAALELAKGRDTFVFLDFQPLIALIASLADDQRASAVATTARAPLPMYMTFAGDGDKRVLTFEMAVAPSAFTGVGSIVQALGAGGAAPPATP